MNRTKQFDELSLSTQEKYIGMESKHPCTMFWDEDADDIARNSKDITPRVFLHVLPIMRKSKGYLEQHGDTVDSQDIARKLNVAPGAVGKSLRELHKMKTFSRREDSVYCYPKMVAFFRKKIKKFRKF